MRRLIQEGFPVAALEARDHQPRHGIVEHLVPEDMLALGLVLNTVGLGLFCWLIFALAVYAVPFFVAVSIGMLTLNSGAGVIGALLVGIVAGGSTLVIGQTAFAMTRSTILRAGIGAIFAIPAAIAGYHVVLAFRNLECPP